MKTFLYVGFLSLFSLSLYAQNLKKDLLFHYDFGKSNRVELLSKAQIRKGALLLDGAGAHARIPDSKNMHLTEKGMTILVTVKLTDPVGSEKLSDLLDTFSAKGNEFIFGRNRKRLYFNFHDGKKWAAPTFANARPGTGEWAQVAAVVERYSDPAQGEVGYRVSLYLNGEKEVSQKFPNVKPRPLNVPINIGKGWGGPWCMKGEVGSIAMYGRALKDGEIAELCSREKRISSLRKGFAEVSKELFQITSQIRKDSSPAACWLADSLERGASTKGDQKKLGEFASLILKNKKSSMEKLARIINGKAMGLHLFLTPDMAALFLTGKGSGTHPLLGLMNRRTGKDIFGERTIGWEIVGRVGKTPCRIMDSDDGLFWDAQWKNGELAITWKAAKEAAFEVNTLLKFTGKRLESSCKVTNFGKGLQLESIVYPSWTFEKKGKGDMLLHPYMSGILQKNPTKESFPLGQSGFYPSGKITMQFGAYYDNSRDGLYFGLEDGLAYVKQYAVSGKRNNLYVTWENPVIADPGHNNFTLHGKAVLELYKGAWYEAGQIYRKFLEKEAAWWIKKLPRSSTPAWFRNNTLWIQGTTLNEKMASSTVETLLFLRSYFELPFGYHWYGWFDTSKGSRPHYFAKPFVSETNRKLKNAGIYTFPYINGRLWHVKDGPNKSDWQYTSHGLKYAAKDRHGKISQEIYGPDVIDTIMCPAAKGWQNTLTSLVFQLAGKEGFTGLYHDQIGTGSPILCYDTSHGHFRNDPRAWLELGYWKMFEKFRKTLQKVNPGCCHTTEENAEAYLKQMDGFLVWRWTDPEQVPLYQSIYSGRAQIIGRLFDNQKPGDKQSIFSKFAQQLVNAEQLGWCAVSTLLADENRLFAKKAMYVRKALLLWFNEGRMLAPVLFREKMPMENSLWGGLTPRRVSMPVIASSAWEAPDGTKMMIFVNTLPKPVTLHPVTGSSWWILKEGASSPVKAQNGAALSMKGRDFQVWISGSRKEAEKVQTTLQKIASFDSGSPSSLMKDFKKRKLTGVPGKRYGVRDISGNLFCLPAPGNSYIGWFNKGAIISFGEFDFGKKGAKEIFIRAGVHARYAGGTITLYAGKPGSMEKIAGSLTLKSTGGFSNYKDHILTLKQPLKGKQNVFFKFNKDAACNFANWYYKE